MFRGVQHINMDAKGRLAMPARQREPLLSQCEGQIVVTIDTQANCLVIYPLPEWERIEGDIQNLPALKPAVKRFQRLMLGYATDLELDGSGRSWTRSWCWWARATNWNCGRKPCGWPSGSRRCRTPVPRRICPKN